MKIPLIFVSNFDFQIGFILPLILSLYSTSSHILLIITAQQHNMQNWIKKDRWQRTEVSVVGEGKYGQTALSGAKEVVM